MHRVLLVLLILELKFIFRTYSKSEYPDTHKTEDVMKHFQYFVIGLGILLMGFRMGHQNFWGNIIFPSTWQLLYDRSLRIPMMRNFPGEYVCTDTVLLVSRTNYRLIDLIGFSPPINKYLPRTQYSQRIQTPKTGRKKQKTIR